MRSTPKGVWKEVEQAVESGSVEEIKDVYIKHNLDYSNNIGGNSQGYVLHLSAEKGKMEIVQHLVKELVNECADNAINDVDKYNETPLHYASDNGHLDIARCLVKEGKANVNVANKYKETPLHKASRNGRLNIVQFLVSEGKANVNVAGRYNEAPLHYATEDGHLDIVQFLVNKGKANVNAAGKDSETPLHIASETGHLDIVQFLVEKGNANINIVGKNNETPLHYATGSGHLDIVQFLVNKGKANVNVAGRDSETPLHIASETGHLEIVQFLVNKGKANVNAAGRYNETPLHFASQHGHLKIVQCLVHECKANVNALNSYNQTPLYYALRGGHLNIVQFLMDGVNKANINVADKDNETPLHIASENGNLDTVRCLVEQGKADVNVIGKDSETPLHRASENGHLDIVQFLVNEVNKADVNVAGKDNETPLHRASENGHFGTVRCLVEQGKADVNVVNEDKETPLHLALREGHLDTVKFLVNEGKADVNVADKDKETPLHDASWKAHLLTVQFFVNECKADVNVVNKYKDTPLHYASQYGKLDTVQFLVNEGKAKVNVVNMYKRTPLHFASLYGRLEIVQFLVNEGKANVNAADKGNRTPLHLASQKGYLDIVRCLVEQGKTNVNVADKNKDTALHVAAKHGRSDIVTCLLFELGADLSVRNAEEETPFEIVLKGREVAATTVRDFYEYVRKNTPTTIVLVKHYVLLYRTLSVRESELQELDELKQICDGFMQEIAKHSSPIDLVKIAVDHKDAFLFYCGDLYQTLIEVFLKDPKNVNLLRATYIVLQGTVQCTESKKGWLTKFWESDIHKKFEKEINELSNPGREAGSHSDDTIFSKDIQEIAKQIRSDYFEEKSGCITDSDTKNCVKEGCAKLSCCKCSRGKDGKEDKNKRTKATIAEQDAVKNQEVDDQTEGEKMMGSSVDNDRKHKNNSSTSENSIKEKITRCIRTILPHMFICKATGIVALFSCVMGVVSYMSDLISDLLVGYEDYTGFSTEVGLFEMILVAFTLLHENINSRNSLYKTHKERLRLILGKYNITPDDWKTSDLNYSENKYMRWVYMTIWPFRVMRKWTCCCIEVPFSVKAILYNILTILMLRPLVDRLVVLLHEPVSLRVFYRQRAEQNRLKQFYLILEQLPELMIQFYTLQIILNNVSNPLRHEDRYKNCRKSFNYHQFNQSSSNGTNLICNALALTRPSLLACGIGFRIFSMSIPFFNIPSGILSLEEGFRTLDPFTPKLSSTMRILLQGCYTLMIPARVFMYATLMHAAHNKSIVFLYIAGRGLAELAVNWYMGLDNREMAHRNPDEAEHERLIKHTEVEMDILEERSMAEGSAMEDGSMEDQGLMEEGSMEEYNESLVESILSSVSIRTRIRRKFTMLWWLILFSIRDIFLISIRDPAAYRSQVSNVSYDSLRSRRAIAWRAMVFIAEGFVGALLIEQYYPCGKESNYFKNTGWLYLILLTFSLTIILIISDLLHPHTVKNDPCKAFLKKSLVVVGTGFLICSLTCISFFLIQSRSTTEMWLAVGTMIFYPLCFGLVIAVIKYDIVLLRFLLCFQSYRLYRPG